ncbi:MAG: metal ABC transporter permease [Treponema sp.]|nr:metal ABC transporter permease [Treponema sp.]
MLTYKFFQNALIVSILIGILSPMIGVFLVLRRYSMIGDTLAHASLAGVAGGLLLDINPILGAFIFTAFAGSLIEFLRGFFKKYSEIILSIILAIGVGVAITIISSGKLHANANSFLFGSVLTVTRTDVWIVLGLSIAAAVTLIFLYDQLIYTVFDEDAARLAKVKVRTINYAFSILVAAAISVSIRIVGMMVIGSLIALPVATSMQVAKSFKGTILWSITFSLIDIVSGLFLSYLFNVAPGGFTALLSALLLLVIIGIKVIRQKTTAGKFKIEE